MNCPICKQNNWENVDRFRIKPVGMHLCHGCGFVSYPERYKNKQEVLEYYRGNQYRTAPTCNNLFTGHKKLNYHSIFLKETIEGWIDEKKNNPVIVDVGAAMGLFAAWWKNLRAENGEILFPNADINGVELTRSFRRVAWHEYGINLTESFDESKKYDLITSYKVLEHIFDPDQELDMYARSLSKNGLLYISVPVWYEKMHNFGVGGWDIEYYYHPDHVNVWSKAHFEYLLAKSGFEIIKQDHALYDSTYLCKVSDKNRPEKVNVSFQDIGPKLALIFAADEVLRAKNFDQAIELWPRFPVARRARYEYSRTKAHENGFEWIKEHHIDSWLSIDPDCWEAYSFATDIAARYDQFDLALKYISKALELQPNSDAHLSVLLNIYKAMANKADNQKNKMEFLGNAINVARKLRVISPQNLAQVTTSLYNDYASIPMPGE